MIRTMACVLAVIALSLTVMGFSVEQEPKTRELPSKQFIEIIDLISPETVNKLPASFVENWPTWVLDTKGVFEKIPDSDGFVQPSSVDTLFQPVDLKPPNFQLALGFHVRDGAIRQIMPAVDCSYDGGIHRNRGLCSVPRAYKWIEFSNGMFGDWKHFQLRAFKRKLPESEEAAEEKWLEMASVPSGNMISKAIERTIFSLAQSAPDELGEGSHVIHSLIDLDDEEESSLEYPKTGNELCIVLEDQLEEDDVLDRHPAGACPGALHVAASAAMAGSESDYLPDAYKPLYQDETLRNPIYEQFRERRKEQ